MKKTVFLSILFLAVASNANPSDNWIAFGLDSCAYLDGATILDGEEIALVWTGGAATTNEVMRLQLAEDGFFPKTLFNVTPAKSGGRFFFFQQDSRETGAVGAKLVATAEVATGRVVAAEPVLGVSPGKTVSVDTEEEAEMVQIEILDVDAKAAGQEAVVAKLVMPNPATGKYDVTLVIDTASPLFVSEETTVAQFAIAGLKSIAERLDAVTVEIPAGKATPGLYYSVLHADNVGFKGQTETVRRLATAAGVSISVPTIDTPTRFFRIAVNLTAE